jgi:hypothetical protein
MVLASIDWTRMKKTLQFGWLIAVLLAALSACAAAQQDAPPAEDAGESLLTHAKEHMGLFEMRTASGADEVQLYPRPLLTYGDSARSNKDGTLWAFGASGRPLAILELYQGNETNTRWTHAVTLTGQAKVTMKTPVAAVWKPDATQIEPVPFADAEPPRDREQRRLSQLKDLARRFTAHEFWDPENSRFEMRLLAQPVHRYDAAEAGIHDGAVFILAHGTNPEVVVLIEALGKTMEASRWHYSLARLGSAELHVELDGKEVWKQGRTPGVVGQPTDPYWLFLTPREAPPADNETVSPAEKEAKPAEKK